VIVVDLPINSKLYWQQSCQLSIALSCSTAIVPTWFIVLELYRWRYAGPHIKDRIYKLFNLSVEEEFHFLLKCQQILYIWEI